MIKKRILYQRELRLSLYQLIIGSIAVSYSLFAYSSGMVLSDFIHIQMGVCLVFGTLSIIMGFATLSSIHRKHEERKWLMKNGTLVKAKILQVKPNEYRRRYKRKYFRIYCTWTAPAGRLIRCKSEPIPVRWRGKDIQACLNATEVDVYVNKSDWSQYCVDILPLFTKAK